MSELPPRNYFPLAVDKVELDGILQPHDRLNQGGKLLTGAIGLEIEVLAPVHVGSGAYGLVNDRVVKQPVTRGGVPVIPGSSIKGVCRQIHEVLTQSRSPFKDNSTGSPKQKGPRQGPPQRSSRTSRSEALFGFLGGQGRISFDDATPVEEVELEVIELSVPYQPQNDVGRRFYGPMPAEADQPPRIPALAIPRGARLRTMLRFRNLVEDELGSVLLSLGIGRFQPKLGGGKYDPFGWVRFEAVSYRLRGPGLRVRKTPWVTGPSKVKRFCGDALTAVPLPPAGKAALRELEKRMRIPAAESGASS